MIALEKLAHSALGPEEVAVPSCEGVIPNANTPCCVEFVDTVLVNIEVEVVDYQINFNASFRCVDKFLHGDTCNCFVVHIVSSYHYQVLRSVYFVPERIPKCVVVIVQLNFRLLYILRLFFLCLHFNNQWLINYHKNKAKRQHFYYPTFTLTNKSSSGTPIPSANSVET